MDNEKKPNYLKNLLKKEENKAVNDDPSKDLKKVLAPIKDETTGLPKEEKKQTEKVKAALQKGKARGLSRGDDTSKRVKSIPVQEFDMGNWEKVQAEKQKAINERAHKQQKQEPQPQQAQHKPSAFQQKAQDQQKAQQVKQQLQKSKESVIKASTLQQWVQKDAQVKKQIQVKKAPPTKGKTK